MRVLLATDGSTGARTATEWLTVFPLPPAAEVLVLAVAALPLVIGVPPRGDFEQALVDGARRAAEDARDVLRRRWPGTTTRVVEGDPREAIPRIAEEWAADLVVVGARGLSAVRRFFLGSVSSAVVREARCPVLVVKEHARAPRTAVIAIDGSPDSAAAARFVAALPLDPALTVRLLGVIERPYAPRTAPATVAPAIRAAIDDIVAERRRELDGALKTLGTEFEGAVAAVERALLVGRPADEILAATSDKDVDLVVVGARGLGLVKRLLLGSVSERVLHEAECSVLVVKGGR